MLNKKDIDSLQRDIVESPLECPLCKMIPLLNHVLTTSQDFKYVSRHVQCLNCQFSYDLHYKLEKVDIPKEGVNKIYFQD